VLNGRNESLTSDVEKVLVRKPPSFKSYAEKTNKTGMDCKQKYQIVKLHTSL